MQILQKFVPVAFFWQSYPAVKQEGTLRKATWGQENIRLNPGDWSKRDSQGDCKRKTLEKTC